MNEPGCINEQYEDERNQYDPMNESMNETLRVNIKNDETQRKNEETTERKKARKKESQFRC